MVTLAQILDDIIDKNRNSTTGALDNNKRTRAINRTLDDLQDYADWDFTRRTKEFDLIDGVNEYSLEDYLGLTCQDVDGSTAVLDFKNPYQLRKRENSHNPWAFRDIKDVQLDIRNNKSVNEYGISQDLLIVNFPKQTSVQVHDCDSLTANGTWTASGDATNLTLDEVDFREGDGSLNFDVSAGTSLVISNTTLSPTFDLTDFENVSYFTVKVYLPTITSFSSIALRWGTDLTANYWNKSETVPAGNQTLIAGWNIFAFKWADADKTGSPDVSALDSLRVTITYSASTTDTDFRVDDIRVGKRLEMELEYYSLAMCQDTAGDYQIRFNSDDVTQTDTLLGSTTAKLTVVQGAVADLFEIIGGKSERDRTDSFKKYEMKKMDLLKKAGHRLVRASRVLNFQRR